MSNQQTNILADIAAELKSANKKYPQFHSCHEAAGVIREEFDEYWEEVRAEKGLVPSYRMVEELTQLAAMCVKEILRYEPGEEEEPAWLADKYINPWGMGK